MRVGNRWMGGVSSAQPSWAIVVWLPGQMMRICSSRHLPVEPDIVRQNQVAPLYRENCGAYRRVELLHLRLSFRCRADAFATAILPSNGFLGNAKRKEAAHWLERIGLHKSGSTILYGAGGGGGGGGAGGGRGGGAGGGRIG